MTDAPYGYCPRCQAPGVSRERRPDGNDRCAKGHVYPSRLAVALFAALTPGEADTFPTQPPQHAVQQPAGPVGPAFVELIELASKRLDAGRIEYGDKSLDRPPAELVAEITEELADVVGWAAVLFHRVQRLRGLVAEGEAAERAARPLTVIAPDGDKSVPVDLGGYPPGSVVHVPAQRLDVPTDSMPPLASDAVGLVGMDPAQQGEDRTVRTKIGPGHVAGTGKLFEWCPWCGDRRPVGESHFCSPPREPGQRMRYCARCGAGLGAPGSVHRCPDPKPKEERDD